MSTFIETGQNTILTKSFSNALLLIHFITILYNIASLHLFIEVPDRFQASAILWKTNSKICLISHWMTPSHLRCKFHVASIHFGGTCRLNCLFLWQLESHLIITNYFSTFLGCVMAILLKTIWQHNILEKQ